MRLQDDPLVDVFVFLCRAMLDALQLTNRRFNVLVQKRAKGDCLRLLEVAELYADATIGPPQFITKLVTTPIRRRDGGLQRENLTLDNATTKERCCWFVNRLRHCVIADKLTFVTQTDSPDLVESIKGTVLLKKGLCWAVRQAIYLDNASRFLRSFIDLKEVEIWSYKRSFRFTDDWFKLFETLGIYRVTFPESACTASTKALISFLFGASSAPGSVDRMLVTSFKRDDWKTLKAVAEQLIEAAVCCTSTHNTTLQVRNQIHRQSDKGYMSVLAKYKDDLRHYRGAETESYINGIRQHDRTCDGHVLNLHKEQFRVQVFCYSGGLQIRRARAEDVEEGFFPAWLETATAQ